MCVNYVCCRQYLIAPRHDNKEFVLSEVFNSTETWQQRMCANCVCCRKYMIDMTVEYCIRHFSIWYLRSSAHNSRRQYRLFATYRRDCARASASASVWPRLMASCSTPRWRSRLCLDQVWRSCAMNSKHWLQKINNTNKCNTVLVTVTTDKIRAHHNNSSNTGCGRVTLQ